MIRFLLNLTATFSLVLLLAAPGVFSGNLVVYEPHLSGIVIHSGAEKFGDFLKISQLPKEDEIHFNLNFSQFEKPALYYQILTIENTSGADITLEIANQNPKSVEVFFDNGIRTQGPTEIKVSQNTSSVVNLLVPAKNLIVSQASFSLKKI